MRRKSVKLDTGKRAEACKSYQQRPSKAVPALQAASGLDIWVTAQAPGMAASGSVRMGSAKHPDYRKRPSSGLRARNTNPSAANM
ncbi:hypothetical protein AURDEDRAFT_175380 [Auricularia subglabra TFB-10046 SS5]|nr:hypothetical protein AURDEDRAFT_175380 [Auricularia subglabra TFB-10046 SS5]